MVRDLLRALSKAVGEGREGWLEGKVTSPHREDLGNRSGRLRGQRAAFPAVRLALRKLWCPSHPQGPGQKF